MDIEKYEILYNSYISFQKYKLHITSNTFKRLELITALDSLHQEETDLAEKYRNCFPEAVIAGMESLLSNVTYHFVEFHNPITITLNVRENEYDTGIYLHISRDGRLSFYSDKVCNASLFIYLTNCGFCNTNLDCIL